MLGAGLAKRPAHVNGYMPAFQTPGKLCFFLKEHLGKPILLPGS